MAVFFFCWKSCRKPYETTEEGLLSLSFIMCIWYNMYNKNKRYFLHKKCNKQMGCKEAGNEQYKGGKQ